MTLHQQIEAVWNALNFDLYSLDDWDDETVREDFLGSFDRDATKNYNMALAFEETKRLILSNMLEALTSPTPYIRLVAQRLVKDNK